MKQKKDEKMIIIRPDLLSSIIFAVFCICLILLAVRYNPLLFILAMIFGFFALLSYAKKITLYPNVKGFLDVDDGTCKRRFFINSIKYKIKDNSLVLCDGSITKTLTNNKKLVRELKKLGAKEELD